MRKLIIKVAVLLGVFPMVSQATASKEKKCDNIKTNKSEALLGLQFSNGYFAKQGDGSILIDQDYKNEVLKGYIAQENYATEVVELLKDLLDDNVKVIGLDDVDFSVMATQDWVIQD